MTPKKLAFSTPSSSATLLRTLPSSSRQSRSRRKLSSTSCPSVILQAPSRWEPGLRLPITEGAPLQPQHLLLPRKHRRMSSWSWEGGRSPLLRAPLSLLGRPRSVPETVDPEMTGTVLQGTQTSVPPSPGEGRGIFPPLLPLTSGSTAPTFSIKEQFPSSLGLSRQVLIVSDSDSGHEYASQHCGVAGRAASSHSTEFSVGLGGSGKC